MLLESASCQAVLIQLFNNQIELVNGVLLAEKLAVLLQPRLLPVDLTASRKIPLHDRLDQQPSQVCYKHDPSMWNPSNSKHLRGNQATVSIWTQRRDNRSQ